MKSHCQQPNVRGRTATCPIYLYKARNPDPPFDQVTDPLTPYTHVFVRSGRRRREVACMKVTRVDKSRRASRRQRRRTAGVVEILRSRGLALDLALALAKAARSKLKNLGSGRTTGSVITSRSKIATYLMRNVMIFNLPPYHIMRYGRSNNMQRR